MKNKKTAFFLIIIFIIIIIRLINLMVTNNNHYNDLLIKKTEKYITIDNAPRGRILDRNGNVLVDNESKRIISYRKLDGITQSDEIKIALELADILEIDVAIDEDVLKEFYLLTHEDDNLITLEEKQQYEERKITKKKLEELKKSRITADMLTNVNPKAAHFYHLMNEGYSYSAKVLKEDNVSLEEWMKISESSISGVTSDLSWQRVYPYGELFRPFLGNVGSISNEMKNEYLKKDYDLNDIVGISYLELEYEEYLRGTKSIYKVNSDNSLTLIEEGKKGNDLVLSIDINIQQKIEELLTDEIKKAKEERNTKYYNHSYMIVGDPLTGEILGISGKSYINETFIDISENIISSSYTLGSVVKGASISVNYLNNLIEPEKKVKDSCIKLYLVPEKCSFKSRGYINDIEALAYSSNYYQYLTAIKLTNNDYRFNMKLNATIDHFQTYRDIFASYGLGVKTGIDLPNEKIGLKGEKISDDLLLNLAIGQYDTYTPIELFQYINTIASGKRMAPSLLNKVTNDNEVIYEKEAKILNNILLNEYYLERLHNGLEQVFTIGTGRGYVNEEYHPVGKTGTSESFYDSDNDGKIDVETVSKSIAYYFPKEKPKYSVIIISPHISYDNSGVSWTSDINRRLSKEISKFLFEFS